MSDPIEVPPGSGVITVKNEGSLALKVKVRSVDDKFPGKWDELEDLFTNAKTNLSTLTEYMRGMVVDRLKGDWSQEDTIDPGAESSFRTRTDTVRVALSLGQGQTQPALKVTVTGCKDRTQVFSFATLANGTIYEVLRRSSIDV
jgi:hypothetical protein